MTHEFDPGYSGMSAKCNQLVARDDIGDDCGLPREDPIHRIDVPCAERPVGGG